MILRKVLTMAVFIIFSNIILFVFISPSYGAETQKDKVKILWKFDPWESSTCCKPWVNYILLNSYQNVYVYEHKEDGIGYIYKLSPNGTPLWNVTLPADSAGSMPLALGSNDTFYVATWYLPPPLGTPLPSYLYAYSSNGVLEWKLNLSYDGPFSDIRIGKNHIYLKSGRYLYSISEKGKIQWKKQMHGAPRTPAYFKDTLYVSDISFSGGRINASYLYAVNLQGDMKLIYSMKKSAISSPVIDKDGNIYVYFDQLLYALHTDGSVKWTTNAHGSLPAIGSNALYLTHHSIHIPGTSNELYALSKENGKILWRLEIDRDNTTAGVYVTPPVIDKNENIYLGDWYSKNNTGYLYSISPDGKMRWKLHLDAGIIATPDIGSNRTVYVGTINGSVYAIKYTDTAMPIKPTPTYDYLNFILWSGVTAAVASAIIIPYYWHRRRRS